MNSGITIQNLMVREFNFMPILQRGAHPRWCCGTPTNFREYSKGKEMKETAEQIREEIIRIDALIEKSKKDIEEVEKKRESLIEQLREKGFLLYEKDSAGQCVTSFSVDDVHAGDHLILAGNSRNYLIQQGRIVSVEVNDKSGLPFGVRCLSTGKRDWVKLEDVKRA